MDAANTEGIPPLELRLPLAAPAQRQLMILDTNIMNYAITSPGGAVIARLNTGIEAAGLVRTGSSGFCMTPFQTLEVLGTRLPEVEVPVQPRKGVEASAIVGSVVDEALAAYAALPELSQPSLGARADERRSFLPEEGRALFDMCVLGPVRQPGITGQIASALAWDHALKAVYPKDIANDVDNFLASLLLVAGHSNISRFRIAKRMWDFFYARGRLIVPEAADGIADAAKAMRLKTRRDFLDCDLIHLACFGWFEDDVVVLTSDPPDAILSRIAVYKGMVQAAAANAPDMEPDRLPAVRPGLIVRCEPDGEISHIFPIERVPTIV